jgi:O-antigen/teichoic acid export membrane protein
MAWELALVGTFIGVAFALFYLGGNLDKDHAAMKLLLLFMGLFLLLANFGMTPAIIEANNETIGETISTNLISSTGGIYTAFLWVVIFVIAYFIIYFIYKLIRGMRIKKNEE